MSMINGIVRFDGSPPGEAAIQPMMEAITDACPDGRETWCGDGAAFGLGLLRTLPQARTANGPVCDPASGLVIVADARIDNRAELRAALGGNTGFSQTDAGLILHAYREWGEQSVERLVGDFAFAIWNPIWRTLFCACDYLGVRPLYYFHAPGSTSIFSSSLSALLALDEVPQDLDEGSLADRLAGLIMEQGRTPYRALSMLPAAHYMTIRDGTIALRRYWQPQAREHIRYSREEEYVETYRTLFEQAVACRLESDGPVSALLSGGLDSGAIAAVAGSMLARQRRSLSTYSFVLSDEQRMVANDEKELAGLIHGMAGIQGCFITTNDFPGRIEELHTLGEGYFPFAGGNPYLGELFRQLDASGSRVLLDGMGGDNCTTCESLIPLQEFLDGFQFRRLARYLAAIAHCYGKSPLHMLLRMLRAHLRKSPTDARRHALERSLLSRDFRERVDIVARTRNNLRFRDAKYRSLEQIMAHRLLLVWMGFQASAMFSQRRVERRFPLLDRRLVEFCLAAPAEQHSFDMNRRLMRRAMANVLPDTIRLRNDKSVNNSPGMDFYLRENLDYYLAAIDSALNDERITEYIDIETMRHRFRLALDAGYTTFMPGPTGRAFMLMHFLQKQDARKHARGACPP